MKKVTIGILSCLVLLGGGLAINTDLIKSVEAKNYTSGQSNISELDKIANEMHETKFLQKIAKELKKEGYNSAEYIMFQSNKGKIEITIPISIKEYKGKQTQDNINKIVNQLAEENNFPSFLVNVKKES